MLSLLALGYEGLSGLEAGAESLPRSLPMCAVAVSMQDIRVLSNYLSCLTLLFPVRVDRHLPLDHTFI